MLSFDNANNGILALLGRNGRATAHQMSKDLSGMGINLTESGIATNSKTTG
jgi:hypothetical protein